MLDARQYMKAYEVYCSMGRRERQIYGLWLTLGNARGIQAQTCIALSTIHNTIYKTRGRIRNVLDEEAGHYEIDWWARSSGLELLLNSDLVLTFPGLPPSVNHLYGRNGNRTFVRPEARAWIDMAIESRQGKGEFGDDRVSVSIVYVVSDRRGWDLDNRTKALQDVLTKRGVWSDDSQVDELHIQRLRMAELPDGMTHVMVSRRQCT